MLYLASVMEKYDPINNSLTIFIDALNIFLRLLSVFGDKKWKYDEVIKLFIFFVLKLNFFFFFLNKFLKLI